jgi:membrane protease YdiL (CAAX protease family)
MDVVIAPVLEELLFRLILQEEVLYKGIRWSIQKSGLPLSKGTTELASKCAAIALASALFAAAHHPHDAVGFTRQWIARFGSSLLYGSLQAATDNVAVPIIAHAAHNALQYGLICK